MTSLCIWKCGSYEETQKEDVIESEPCDFSALILKFWLEKLWLELQIYIADKRR